MRTHYSWVLAWAGTSSVFALYTSWCVAFFLPQRTPSQGIPLGVSIYIAHKTGEELLSNVHTVDQVFMFYQFLLTCHCWARFYCQYVVGGKTFLLLFMGVGSSWLESTIVFFLLLLRWDCRLLQVTTSFLMLLPGHTL